VYRAQLGLRRLARRGADVDHARYFVFHVPAAARPCMNKRSTLRRIALAVIAGAGLAVWTFPVIWGLLTSFKTERDVLAYPPAWLFKPTLDNYREVIFGASSIVPNLWSSFVVSTSATLLTMLIAVPAAYALA